MKVHPTPFTPKALTFFKQLEKNNDRAWFAPRKVYFEEHIRGPMLELIEAVGDGLRKFAADYVVEPKKALYRIYRDTRFSKDKSPYKTHIGAMFPGKGLPKHAGAGFYFHLAHTGVVIAGGMYMPGPPELNAVRQAIAANPQAFSKLVESKATVHAVGPLAGLKCARMPKGFEVDHPAAEYFRMKQWYFDISLDAKAACLPALHLEIVNRFKRMAPLVNFLNNAARASLDDEPSEDTMPKRPAPMF